MPSTPFTDGTLPKLADGTIGVDCTETARPPACDNRNGTAPWQRSKELCADVNGRPRPPRTPELWEYLRPVLARRLARLPVSTSRSLGARARLAPRPRERRSPGAHRAAGRRSGQDPGDDSEEPEPPGGGDPGGVGRRRRPRHLGRDVLPGVLAELGGKQGRPS